MRIPLPSILLLVTLTACATVSTSREPGSLPESYSNGTLEPAVTVEPVTDKKAEAYASFIQGSMSAGAGRKEEAVGYFENAASLDPDSDIVLMELLQLYLETGRKTEAEQAAVNILEVKPLEPLFTMVILPQCWSINIHFIYTLYKKLKLSMLIPFSH
jgi:tetratricopeptide (TPR) repeat protein